MSDATPTPSSSIFTIRSTPTAGVTMAAPGFIYHSPKHVIFRAVFTTCWKNGATHRGLAHMKSSRQPTEPASHGRWHISQRSGRPSPHARPGRAAQHAPDGRRPTVPHAHRRAHTTAHARTHALAPQANGGPAAQARETHARPTGDEGKVKSPCAARRPSRFALPCPSFACPSFACEARSSLIAAPPPPACDRTKIGRTPYGASAPSAARREIGFKLNASARARRQVTSANRLCFALCVHVDRSRGRGAAQALGVSGYGAA
ncbi:hypothetical protein HYPSUDRAFT_208687 [Hypholoma sublateritium FD-334 SS-4]|uniref:Uncharacterized protein n=1 Tax=Hypholoma sublateritium (strain FD-334 SS-4) TaxID=945553 RepID=A0A0D2NCX6_HYPSF|nr:hypothetical protein HYPSUDRAFT_208687 [Hypholoma sublateritium FD-334 SS-4]